MSIMSQNPTPESGMNSTTTNDRFTSGPVSGTGAATPRAAERLRAIHDLIRSGHYHVPATAIADRMIERLVANRRERTD